MSLPFDMNKLLDQAKQAKQNLLEMRETGVAGAGLVSITMDGRYNAHEVSIDDSLLTSPKSVLQDLIAAAINDASQKIENNMQQQYSNLGQLFSRDA